MGSGEFWSHTGHCMPDKTGPTECSLNLYPNSALEATQVAVSEDAVSLQGLPTPVVCSLELQRVPHAGKGQ